MKRYTLAAFAAVFVTAIAPLQASAGVLMPVAEVPGSVPHSTTPIGLSDSGVVTGGYVGSNAISLPGSALVHTVPFRTVAMMPQLRHECSCRS